MGSGSGLRLGLRVRVRVRVRVGVRVRVLCEAVLHLLLEQPAHHDERADVVDRIGGEAQRETDATRRQDEVDVLVVLLIGHLARVRVRVRVSLTLVLTLTLTLPLP